MVLVDYIGIFWHFRILLTDVHLCVQLLTCPPKCGRSWVQFPIR